MTSNYRRTSFAVAVAVCMAPLFVAGPVLAVQGQSRLEGPLPPPPESPWRSPYLDSRLVQLAGIERTEGPAAAARYAASNAIRLDPDQQVSVLIHEGTPASAAQSEAAIAARVAQFGGEVLGRTGDLTEARLAVEAVEWLPGPREIVWIEPAPIPVALAVTSQGVAVTHAKQLQDSGAEYRPSAAPVRVGVLDLGFQGYQSLLGTELPSTVVARSFSPQGIGAGGVHGTACAEIVHDMAPDAALYFANFDSVTSHSQAVDWLISQKVDVISYSIGWFNQGPGDGRGVVNDHVRRAMGAGIKWVAAAGNEAQTHWEATFSDADGDGWHNYTAADEGNTISLRAGDTLAVYLNWDDWFQSSQDYDLYIVDSVTGKIVAGSTNAQSGTQPPTEAVGIWTLVDRTYYVAIYRYRASRAVKLEAFFDIESAMGRMEYVVPEGSLTIPADTDGAIAVGATYWANDNGELFSSRGPTSDGRIKPDIAAPDGVDSASYQRQPFYGTSAATPHVAGAIALLKQRFGVYSLDQVAQILYGRAVDRGPNGKDNQYGQGRLDLIGQ
jgi:hypothetical protein